MQNRRERLKHAEKDSTEKSIEQKITYPRDVYFNGLKVGLQETNGDIIFTDFKTGMQMTELLQNKTYGITDRDGKGNTTSFATIIALGTREDVKSEKRKLELNKRKGQIF